MTIALSKEISRMYVCVFCCEIQKLKLLSKITCHCVVTLLCCLRTRTSDAELKLEFFHLFNEAVTCIDLHFEPDVSVTRCWLMEHIRGTSTFLLYTLYTNFLSKIYGIICNTVIIIKVLKLTWLSFKDMASIRLFFFQ